MPIFVLSELSAWKITYGTQAVGSILLQQLRRVVTRQMTFPFQTAYTWNIPITPFYIYALYYCWRRAKNWKSCRCSTRRNVYIYMIYTLFLFSCIQVPLFQTAVLVAIIQSIQWIWLSSLSSSQSRSKPGTMGNMTHGLDSGLTNQFHTILHTSGPENGPVNFNSSTHDGSYQDHPAKACTQHKTLR